MNYRPDIDGLRAIAVVPVVLFHANVAGFTGGFVGVDVFFVISGFLITTIIRNELENGNFSIVRFYERRARRILPALFAVMAAALIAGWFLMSPAAYDKLGQSIIATLFFVSNIWFWQSSGGYFAGPTDYLPMVHTWSLAVEEQFYIFFPLLLILLYRIGRGAVLPVVLILTLGSLAVAIWATPRMPSAAFYLLPTRIWELSFGALLALGLLPAALSRGWREAAAVLGLLAIAVPVFIYDRTTSFPGLAALPPVLGATLIIWAGGGGSGQTFVGRLLSLRPVVFVGLLSYSLYLWHWPIMAFLRERLFTVHFAPEWQLATIAASFVAAWLSWRFVERPFRSRAVSRWAGGQIFRASLLGTSVIVLVAGGVVLTLGVRQRFSPQQLDQLASITTSFQQGDRCFGARPIASLCVFGEADSSTAPAWLVWGDSHAGSMLPAVIDVADRHQRNVIFANKGNCPPVPGVGRTDMPPAEDGSCERFRLRIMEHVIANERIETVFLVARWPIYGEGTLIEGEGHSDFRLYDMAAPDDHADNPTVLNIALTQLVQQLTDAGKEVMIVESVPELPWHVPARIRAEILFGTRFSDDTVQLEDVIERQRRTNAALRPMDQIPGSRVIRIAEALCNPACPMRNGFSAYYRDHNHLTYNGAIQLVAPILNAAILPATALVDGH